MNHELSVSKSIEINLSPEQVWCGLTDPEIIKDYLYGTSTKTTWQPGSPILFEGEWQGQTYQDKGVVKQFEPHEKISYTYWSGFSGLEDKPENYSLVTYELSPKGDNKTIFTWTQKGFGSEESYNHSKNGMTDFLQKLKEVIEQRCA
jgi:uncharacterized protein YndB with AHSA1/START domain